MRDINRLENELGIELCSHNQLKYYGIDFYFLHNKSSSKLDLNYNCYEINLYDFKKALVEFRDFKINELSDIISALEKDNNDVFKYSFFNSLIDNFDFSKILETDAIDCFFKETDSKRIKLAYKAIRIINYLKRIDCELNKK